MPPHPSYAGTGGRSQEISDLQVTRKTLLSLAARDDEPAAGAAGPAAPTPAPPGHPACAPLTRTPNPTPTTKETSTRETSSERAFEHG
jgi:hypothetical protein